RAPDTKPRDGVGRQPVETIGAETDLAAVGPREAADHVEERRLARAVRTDETRDRAFGHGKGAAGEGLDAAEPLGDAGCGAQIGREVLRGACAGIASSRDASIAAYHMSDLGTPQRGRADV